MGAAERAALGGEGAKAKGGALGGGVGVIQQGAAGCSAVNFFDVTGASGEAT